jgi:hypothetical protein
MKAFYYLETPGRVVTHSKMPKRWFRVRVVLEALVFVGPCDVVDTHRAAACRLTATQGASCARRQLVAECKFCCGVLFFVECKTTHWRLHEACLVFVAL